MSAPKKPKRQLAVFQPGDGSGARAGAPETAPGGGSERAVIRVEGMDCGACEAKVETGLKRLAGVREVEASVSTGRVRVAYDPETSVQELARRIEDLGYEAKLGKEGRFSVSGMDCAACAAKVEGVVKKLSGVSETRVSVPAETLTVTYDDAVMGEAEIRRAVEGAGYGIRGREEAPAEAERRSFWQEPETWTTAAAGALVVLGFVLQWFFAVPESVADIVFAVAIVVGGAPIFRNAWRSVRGGFALDMNVLMSVAAVGAAGIGEWPEGAVVVFLFAVGEALESFSMDRARRSIRGLMDLSPKRARLLRDGLETEVPVREVGAGDVVVIRPGERLPADGVVVGGSSTVNQAPITGESVPVLKEEGAEVFAGTINGEGSLEVRATKEYAETTVSRIIRLVEEAQESKAPAQRFIDRFARYYTPAVVAGAALVFLVPPLAFGGLWGEWFYRALVLLVIACPCALVISTPVSVVSALAASARAGALIKGGAHLEAMGKVRAVAFDKTGTLTEGRPRVTDIVPLNGVPAEEALSLAASLEGRSQHPLGQAIVGAAREADLEAKPVEGFSSVTGRGVRGRVGDRELLAGNRRLFEEAGVSVDGAGEHLEALEAAGRTAILLGTPGGEALAVFGVADALREGVGEDLRRLKEAGVREVSMLTGDNEGVARSIASELGIGYRAGLKPEDKLGAIRELRESYGPVAMVGDGVNDAPALAEADVGVAMGAAGTDTAIETADVALMSDDLSRLAETVRRARATMRVIRQNVVFSIGTKAVFLVLAGLGVANLWLAILADTGASLIVIANGLRLLRK